MAKTETNASGVKASIVELSEKLSKEITLDKKTGVATVAPGAYERLLPEDVTMEQVKKIFEHNQAFLSAGQRALGVVSIPVMKKDKELDRTTLTVPIVGKDFMGFAFERTKEVRAPGSDTTVTKYGACQAEMVIHGSKNRGDMSKVRAELAEMAMDAFK